MISMKRKKSTKPADDTMPALADFPDFSAAHDRLEELRRDLSIADQRLGELRGALSETPRAEALRAEIRAAEEEIVVADRAMEDFRRRHFALGNNESRRLREDTPLQRQLARNELPDLESRRRAADQHVRLAKDRLHEELTRPRPSLAAQTILDPAGAEQRRATEHEIAELSDRRRAIAEAVELQAEIVARARLAAVRKMREELVPRQDALVRELASALQSLIEASERLAAFNNLASAQGLDLPGVGLAYPQLGVLRTAAPIWFEEQRLAGRLS